METTIRDIQAALLGGQVTTEQLVNLYLDRIKAYNGRCVEEPDGILGRIVTIPNAGQINALATLNLRPAARFRWGFDDRKARSMTDATDNDPAMPDALEIARQQDAALAATGKLAGPLHGVVMAIKDQYDTFDMRTTSGGDAPWANDRPPDDATFIARLREAGAIILAKANLAEYASGGARSAFGGTFCNPYDTERSPNASSSGSGTAVAANLVTCAIAEETSSSVRGPAVANNAVGIAPTQELVSRDGMIGAGINTRVGPICRTVEDTARILDVIAGYDPKDEMTAFNVGQRPDDPYASYTHAKRLDGVRIGVLREYMSKKLFAQADAETIDTVEKQLDVLRGLGATIVDPGPDGGLFQGCMDKYAPYLANVLFARKFPEKFPLDADGKPQGDHVATFVDLYFEPGDMAGKFTLRDFERIRGEGEGKYYMNRYLRERGDANITSNADIISKGTYYDDDRFPDRKATREQAEQAMQYDMSDRMLLRYAVRQVVTQCMQLQNLDAVTYPTSTLPVPKLGAPTEPAINGRDRGGVWTFLGQQGFPAITVPAGFTTMVYDRVANPDDKDAPILVGPIPARLPIGIDFLGRPFSEPMLFRIAAAYEAATHHRMSPPGFGPVGQNGAMPISAR
ncbi:MAG: amidase [Gammaproteobacteria bacterium]|nr:amidase [Gammaproteobacteria bacterium]